MTQAFLKKSLEQHLDDYRQYHQNPINQKMHLIGIPLVTMSILLLLDLLGPKYTSEIFILVVLLHYLRLSKSYAFWVAVAIIPLDFLCGYWVRSGLGWAAFAVTFIVGWIFQLWGHVYEGRRPALVDNFLQVFNAPLFIVYELRTWLKGDGAKSA